MTFSNVCIWGFAGAILCAFVGLVGGDIQVYAFSYFVIGGLLAYFAEATQSLLSSPVDSN